MTEFSRLRNLSHDLHRLDHAVVKDGAVKAVVLDHFSRNIYATAILHNAMAQSAGLSVPLPALQGFAVKQGAAVVSIPPIDRHGKGTVAEANQSAFESLPIPCRQINAVFLIKRDVEQNRNIAYTRRGKSDLGRLQDFPFRIAQSEQRAGGGVGWGVATRHRLSVRLKTAVSRANSYVRKEGSLRCLAKLGGLRSFETVGGAR